MIRDVPRRLERSKGYSQLVKDPWVEVCDAWRPGEGLNLQVEMVIDLVSRLLVKPGASSILYVLRTRLAKTKSHVPKNPPFFFSPLPCLPLSFPSPNHRASSTPNSLRKRRRRRMRRVGNTRNLPLPGDLVQGDGVTPDGDELAVHLDLVLRPHHRQVVVDLNPPRRGNVSHQAPLGPGLFSFISSSVPFLLHALGNSSAPPPPLSGIWPLLLSPFPSNTPTEPSKLEPGVFRPSLHDVTPATKTMTSLRIDKRE